MWIRALIGSCVVALAQHLACICCFCATGAGRRVARGAPLFSAAQRFAEKKCCACLFRRKREKKLRHLLAFAVGEKRFKAFKRTLSSGFRSYTHAYYTPFFGLRRPPGYNTPSGSCCALRSRRRSLNERSVWYSSSSQFSHEKKVPWGDSRANNLTWRQ